MSNKLTTEGFREIQQRVDGQYRHAKGEDIIERMRLDRIELLAELERIRPEWVSVAAGQHRYGYTYDLAGTTADSPRPVWIGKGWFDEQWGRWVDANTHKPFPATTEVTHYFKTLTPPEMIGQPDGQ